MAVNARTVLCISWLLATIAYADTYADLFAEAAKLSQQGQYKQAVAKYEAALAIRPGAPEALNNLAVMYYQLHRFPEAFDTSSEIWRTHPELKSAALIAGMSAIQCNKAKEAIAPLRQLQQTDPGNRDGSLALASAYVALNQFQEAGTVYDRQIKSNPSDTIAWYGRAVCYEHLAENASRKLARTPGGAVYSKRLLSQYFESAGNAKLAEEAFGDATSLSTASTSTPEAQRIYEAARAFADESRNSFEQLLKLAPDSWQAALFLGDVERQHGKLVDALAHYQRAAVMQPDSPAPLLGMGTVYWQMGDFEKASSHLQRVLELNPSANQAVFELANIAVRRHADAEAIPLLEKYLSLQPDAFAAHADLGRAYAHLGKTEEAVRELKLAAASDERGDIHYELSSALRKSGHIREADAALLQSKELRQAQLEKEQRLHAAH